VPVRRRLGDEVRTDVAVRTGTILDHHRLAKDLGHPRGDQARQDVARATGREGDDDSEGPRESRLAAGKGWEGEECRDGQQGAAAHRRGPQSSRVRGSYHKRGGSAWRALAATMPGEVTAI
jgi:hypothetical protein